MREYAFIINVLRATTTSVTIKTKIIESTRVNIIIRACARDDVPTQRPVYDRRA